MKILEISGSSRKGSYNWGLLEAAGELLPAGASLEIFDVSHFPLFIQDNERDPPQEIRLFKKKIHEKQTRSSSERQNTTTRSPR